MTAIMNDKYRSKLLRKRDTLQTDVPIKIPVYMHMVQEGWSSGISSRALIMQLMNKSDLDFEVTNTGIWKNINPGICWALLIEMK